MEAASDVSTTKVEEEEMIAPADQLAVAAAAAATTTTTEASAWEKRVRIVREHYERKGYLVRSSLQFGCELVLYAGALGSVHSDFCIHVVPEGIDHYL